MLTLTEENYLKAVYHLADAGKSVTTNELAEVMNTKPATVTDMIKRLSGKALISYEPYYGVKITRQGKAEALKVIRKHRLWETFLVKTLGIPWDEVHEIAEQLEHIQSPLLIERLDKFLGFPTTDPHGHPIPDSNGKIVTAPQFILSTIPAKKKVFVHSVKDGSSSFLKYLSKIGVYIGASLSAISQVGFDGSLELLIDQKKKVFSSKKISDNI